MVRPLGPASFSFDPRGPASAAPVAYDDDNDDIRSHDDPPTAAVSASKHQPAPVDEISITIYAKDGTDDGATLDSAIGSHLSLQDSEANDLADLCPPSQPEAPTVANAVPTTTTSSVPTHQQPLDEVSSTIDSNTDGNRDSEVCAICLEELAPGEEECVLPRCEHAFHDDCLCRWLFVKSTCPLCRDCLIERQSSDDEDSSNDFDTDDDGNILAPADLPEFDYVPLHVGEEGLFSDDDDIYDMHDDI